MRVNKKEGIEKIRIEHNRPLFWFIIFLIFLLIVVIVFLKIETQKKMNLNNLTNNTQIANPASVNCINDNGSLSIRTDQNGSQYGVCIKNGKECEEWALFRGECNFTAGSYDQNVTSCLQDSDCVPEQCCHATSCINKANKFACNLFCTQECKPNTLDCGQGSCKCINNKCAASLA